MVMKMPRGNGRKVASGIVIIGSVLGATGIAKADTNLVQNPGFEDTPGSFGPDWNLNDPSGYTFVNPDPETTAGGNTILPHTGLYQANFGAAGAPGIISQDISTATPGVYHIDFWLWSDGVFDTTTLPPSISQFTVSFGSLQGFDMADIPQTTSVNPADNNYIEKSFDALATGPTTTLSFAGRDDLGYIQLDDVSVTFVSAPEPASLALLGLTGLGLVIGRPRR